MQQTTTRHGSFEELELYRTAREFRKKMYRVAKSLPDTEKFVLNPQMRKAALSVTNNIAEGHGRYHYADNIRFVLIARGSMSELVDDLNTCEDEGYLTPAEVAGLKAEAASVMRLINGYIRYLRESKTGANLGLREDSVPYRVNDDDLSWLDELLAESPITDRGSPITHHPPP